MGGTSGQLHGDAAADGWWLTTMGVMDTSGRADAAGRDEHIEGISLEWTTDRLDQTLSAGARDSRAARGSESSLSLFPLWMRRGSHPTYGGLGGRPATWTGSRIGVISRAGRTWPWS